MIITIDGPSGTGKSTVARRVAEKLGWTYFDTGAIYRGVTWGVLQKGISPTDSKGLSEFLKTFHFETLRSEKGPRYLVNGKDVTDEIRTQVINQHVSEVSAQKVVRETLLELQRNDGKKGGSVFDGRDMGSVVFPNCPIKIYLDAAPEVRAQRRLKELRDKFPQDMEGFDENRMREELDRRDAYDKERPLAPLVCPKNALVIDTSALTIEEVANKIVQHAQKKIGRLLPGWFYSKKMGFLYRFVIFCVWNFFKLFYRHRVYGTEHFVDCTAIIAPNHSSYYDPPIAAISWPNEVHFLAREGLFKPFLFGSFIRALNSHPVSGDVGDVSVFKTILKILSEEKQIIIFPEGGRTDGQLQEIKPGIGMLLMRSKGVIIPTYIHGAYETWDRKRKFPKLSGRIACVFGKAIPWDRFAHLEKRAAQEKIAKELGTALKELKKWYLAGAKGTPP